MTTELITLVGLMAVAVLALATVLVIHHDTPSRFHQPPRSHERDEFVRTDPSWH